MKSVCLIASYGPSLVNFRGPLIAELRAAGIEVSVIASDLDSPTRSELTRLGIRWLEVPLQRNTIGILGDLSYLARLVVALRKIGPEAILPYTVKPVIYGSFAGRLAGVPLRMALISGRGTILSDEGTASRWQRWIVEQLYRLALRGAATVLFQNHDDLAYFRRRGLIAPNSAAHVVQGSGVDTMRFACTPLPAQNSFLMVARFLHSKGIREYITAADDIRKEFPEVRFRLAGWFESPPAGVTPGELESWNGNGQVEVLGQLEDVRPALADCSTFVLPSYYGEGIPRTILEAMAMGRAVVTTDCAGCRETVEAGQNGLLIPPRDAAALSDALASLLRRPESMAAMGLAGRRIAVRRYDARVVAVETAGFIMAASNSRNHDDGDAGQRG